MALTFQDLELSGRYDTTGNLHWDRTPAVSPIMALVGVGLYEDVATERQITEAAGHLGWRLASRRDRAGRSCDLHLRRPIQVHPQATTASA